MKRPLLHALMTPWRDLATVTAALLLCACQPQSRSSEQRHETIDLIQAVASGDLVSVTRTLQHAPDFSQLTDQDEPLIISALQNGHLAIARLLLEAGANPNATNQNGDSLLNLAIQNGHAWLVSDLKKHGADFRQNGKSGSLLHLASHAEQEHLFLSLLSEGIDPNLTDEIGDSALHLAISRGQKNLLKPLARSGAKLDQANAEGLLPVHLALLTQDDRLLASLLATGAPVHLPAQINGSWITPLELALEGRRLYATRLLLQYGARDPKLIYQAVKLGGRDGYDFLSLFSEFQFEANPALAPLRDTPLALAIRLGEQRMATKLLAMGASPSAIGQEGQPPLHMAVALKNAPLVSLLLDRKADPNQPFTRPVSDEFLSLVKSEGIAKWALQKTTRVTPLMVAVDGDDLDSARALLAYHAHRNATTTFGKTNRMWPLTFATRRNNVDMIQLVLGREPKTGEHWIKVDLSEQRAWVYNRNDEVILTTRISSGKKGHATPTGEFVITNKYRDWTSTIYDAKMPWFQRLSASDFGFHEGNVPNHPASAGCIRVPAGTAKKLFDITRVGDFVVIVP